MRDNFDNNDEIQDTSGFNQEDLAAYIDSGFACVELTLLAAKEKIDSVEGLAQENATSHRAMVRRFEHKIAEQDRRIARLERLLGK